MSVVNTDNYKDVLFGNTEHVGNVTYKEILDKTQQYVADYNSNLFTTAQNQSEESIKENEEKIKTVIDQFVSRMKYSLEDEGISHDQLVQTLFNDMVRYSFLEYWLNKPGVEEININAWNDVEVIQKGQRPQRLEEAFTSPKHAFDVVRRMLSTHGIIIDTSSPCVVGYLGEGIRICCFKSPIISEEDGIAASIRIVRPNAVTKDSLISVETARPDELDLMSMLINHGVSVCAAGSTGSGKTTTLSYLLTTIPDNKRLITMEEGSREFSLKKTDKNGKVVNSVVSLLTRESENEQKRVSLQKLVELSMRMNPEIIAVGEMRSTEAYEVSEVARTGHTVVSTIHSDSAKATYKKMMTLAYKKYQLDSAFMMNLMIEAFPVVFFQKQLEDGSRKIMEIIEGKKYENGVVQYNTLYKYHITDTVKDENGKVLEIHGKHIKVHEMSKELQQKLLENGASKEELEKFLSIPVEKELDKGVDF